MTAYKQVPYRQDEPALPIAGRVTQASDESGPWPCQLVRRDGDPAIRSSKGLPVEAAKHPPNNWGDSPVGPAALGEYPILAGPHIVVPQTEGEPDQRGRLSNGKTSRGQWPRITASGQHRAENYRSNGISHSRPGNDSLAQRQGAPLQRLRSPLPADTVNKEDAQIGRPCRRGGTQCRDITELRR
jgi:hypothetical protein